MFLFISICCLFFTLLFTAAIYDFLKLKISNKLVLIVIISFVLCHYLDRTFSDKHLFQAILTHIIYASIIFILTFTLYCFRIFGGGDAKLIPAVTLWLTPEHIISFIVIMTIAGFFLALIGLILKNYILPQKPLDFLVKAKIVKSEWLKSLANGKNVIPYGIAISLGGMGAFFAQAQKVFILY